MTTTIRSEFDSGGYVAIMTKAGETNPVKISTLQNRPIDPTSKTAVAFMWARKPKDWKSGDTARWIIHGDYDQSILENVGASLKLLKHTMTWEANGTNTAVTSENRFVEFCKVAFEGEVAYQVETTNTVWISFPT